MCITKYLFLQGNIIKFFDRNPLLTLPAFHPWSFIMPRDAASVPSLVVDRNLTDDASCRPLDWQWFRDADFLWQNWEKFGKCDLETILYRNIRTCQPQQNFHFMPPFNILKIHSHKIFILHFSIVGVFVHVKTFYVFTIYSKIAKPHWPIYIFQYSNLKKEPQKQHALSSTHYRKSYSYWPPQLQDVTWQRVILKKFPTPRLFAFA